MSGQFAIICGVGMTVTYSKAKVKKFKVATNHVPLCQIGAQNSARDLARKNSEVSNKLSVRRSRQPSYEKTLLKQRPDILCNQAGVSALCARKIVSLI